MRNDPLKMGSGRGSPVPRTLENLRRGRGRPLSCEKAAGGPPARARASFPVRAAPRLRPGHLFSVFFESRR